MSAIDLALKKVRENLPDDLEHYISAFPTQILLKRRMAYDGSNQLEYQGFALPGTPTASPGWLILNFTYSSGLNTQIDIATGAASFNQSWDNRTNLVYS